MGDTHWARLTRGVEPTRLRRFDAPAFSADAARAVLARLAVAEAPADFVPPPPRHATPPPEAVAPAEADGLTPPSPDDAPFEVTDADVQQAASLDEAPIEVDDFEEIVDETFGPSADDPDEAPELAAEASPLVVDDDFEIEEVIEQPPVHFEPIVLADPSGEDADIDFDGFDDDLPGAHGSVAEDLAQFFDEDEGAPGAADREADVARLDDSRAGEASDEADRQQDVRSSVKKLFRRD
ncbi:MAG: hypothetical protein H6704_16165 [Myxococcales bacterium]|nr:hypothetical protein [Myxococcales bacterium]